MFEEDRERTTYYKRSELPEDPKDQPQAQIVQPQPETSQAVEEANNLDQPQAEILQPQPETSQPVEDFQIPDLVYIATPEDGKTKEEFIIKRIIKHQIDAPTERLMFLIEWDGYPQEEEFTWEFEEELTKCYTVVQNYRNSQVDLRDQPTPL